MSASDRGGRRFGQPDVAHLPLLDQYVEGLSAAERDRIKLYLNFDMVASPNYIFGVYDGDDSGETAPSDDFIPEGSAEIEDVFRLERYLAHVDTIFARAFGQDAMAKAAEPVFTSTGESAGLNWPQRRLEITPAGRAVLNGETDWMSLSPPGRETRTE
mgnify:CR=1 FL=1